MACRLSADNVDSSDQTFNVVICEKQTLSITCSLYISNSIYPEL